MGFQEENTFIPTHSKVCGFFNSSVAISKLIVYNCVVLKGTDIFYNKV